MPRLHLLRHHRRAASDQAKAPPTSKTPPPQLSSTSSPIPRTSPPPVPESSLPQLGLSGSPSLGTPEQWLSSSSSSATAVRASTELLASKSSPKKSKPSKSSDANRTKTTSPKSSNGAISASTSAAHPAGGHTHNNSSGSSSNAKDAIASYRRNAKLTLLNPMTLLMRRRSSQPTVEKTKSARDLPDDFDPGIIYGTRHPDWSSGPKRGDQKILTPVNGRHPPPALGSPVLLTTPNKLLKVEVVADESPTAHAEREKRHTPQFTEHFGDGEPAKPTVQPEAVKPRAVHRGPETTVVVGPRPPVTNPRVYGPPPRTTAPPPPPPPPPPELVETLQDSDSDNEGELHSPPDASPADGRLRVSLFDHPLSLPHHLTANSSRFSFEGSSATGESTQDDLHNPDRAESQGYDRFDPDDSDAEQDVDLEDMDDDGDDDDEGFGRANEGLFGGEITPVMQMGNIGIALSKDSTPEARTPVKAQFTELPEGGGLPSMDPSPGTVVPFPGAGGAQMPLSKRIGNPRGYDLSDDSDLDFLEQDGMAGYEDEEDDMYFDDGIIMDNSYQSPPYHTPETGTSSPTHEDATTTTTTTTTNNTHHPTTHINPLLAADPRLSLSTVGVSSGGAMLAEDGSMSPTHGSATTGGGAGTSNQSFPPFLNPIGGGLGCTQSQAQFYAPDDTILEPDGTPMAINTLTRSLWMYQREQQRLADTANAGYESDYNGDYGSQSGYYSVDDDDDGGVAGYEDEDDTMVAEANAEALAYDTEFYGQEFGFYPAPPSSGSIHGDALDEQTAAYLGGYFGTPGGEVLQRPPLLRRPSLTPISERSESSWRNSMVFPVDGWKGLGAQRPLSALSFGAASPAEENEGGLEQLKRLRRGAWGGSNGSMRSSLGAGGDANSPGPSPGVGYSGVGVVGASPSTGAGAGWYGVGTAGISTTASPLGAMAPPRLGGSPPLGGLSAPPGLKSPPGLSVPPGLALPPGLSAPPGLGSPPGLSHPGSMAMLPTKGSFEEQQLLQMQGRALMQQQWQGHGQTHYLPQYPEQGVYMGGQNGDPQYQAYGQSQVQEPQTQSQALTKLSKATTADSSYASAVGSPIDDADAGGSPGGGRDDEKRQKEVEKWVFGRQGSRGSEERA